MMDDSVADEGSIPSKKKLKLDEELMIEPVLGDEFADTCVTLDDAIACPIIDRKCIQSLIKHLNAHYPLPKLMHLKRVSLATAVGEDGQEKQLMILICSVTAAMATVGTLSKQELFCGGSNNCDVNMVALLDAIGEPVIVRVPSMAPLTRAQFNAMSQFWSMNFHENKSVSRLLGPAAFNAEQRVTITRHLREAASLAGDALNSGCGEPVGCVVVNPSDNAIIAVASDRRFVDCLQHAVMVCVDLIAQQQLQQQQGHVSMMSSTGVAGRASIPYLCTGYDIYVNREPCIMCAMALLHSRIGRVFYIDGRREDGGGALGTRYKLHTIAALNHKFDVFKCRLVNLD